MQATVLKDEAAARAENVVAVSAVDDHALFKRRIMSKGRDGFEPLYRVLVAHLLERRAAPERPRADFHPALGNGDALKSRAAIERAGAGLLLLPSPLRSRRCRRQSI